MPRINSFHVLLCCSCFAALNIYKGTTIDEKFSSSLLRGSKFVIELDTANTSQPSLAYSQSFGFFDDITDDHWKLHQKRAVEHVNHKNPNNVLVGKSKLWYANVSSEMAPSCYCIYCISKLRCR